ncbi:TPA: hypothetical protein ACQ0F8_001971 [Streptococcus agalactiae]|nr:hypothetical protein [Streptococcus agalactiae]HEO4177398.1 hypothetical protein [Streptococcus agalactiae]
MFYIISFLYVLSITIVIDSYYYRKKIIDSVFNVPLFFRLMIWTMRIGLKFIFIYLIIKIFVSGAQSITFPMLLGFILGKCCFISAKRNPNHFILLFLDNYLQKHALNQFKTCPKNHETRIFYRRVLNSEEVCYYLLNKNHMLIFLGFFYNLDHLAYGFLMAEQQGELGRIILQNYSDLVYYPYEDITYKGEQKWLSKELYCSYSHEVISQDIHLGIAIINS